MAGLEASCKPLKNLDLTARGHYKSLLKRGRDQEKAENFEGALGAYLDALELADDDESLHHGIVRSARVLGFLGI